MKTLAILTTEFLKLRRAKVTWVTLGAYLMIGLVVAFLIWMIGHPGLAENLGLVGQKVNFASSGVTADWPGLLGMFAEMSGLGGMIIYSILVAWLFGREYAEGTAKNFLALPLGRPRFVLSKLVVSAAWFALLSLALLAEAFLVGRLLGLAGWSTAVFWREVSNILLAGLLTLGLGPAVAWIAVASRGYLAPLGYTIFTLVIGTALGATNWARWCPWSIIPLFSGAAGPRTQEIGPASFLILGLFFLASTLGTCLTLSWADNSQ